MRHNGQREPSRRARVRPERSVIGRPVQRLSQKCAVSALSQARSCHSRGKLAEKACLTGSKNFVSELWNAYKHLGAVTSSPSRANRDILSER
jgi:hypothetical protein